MTDITHQSNFPDNVEPERRVDLVQYRNGMYQAVLDDMYSELHTTSLEAYKDVLRQYEQAQESKLELPY